MAKRKYFTRFSNFFLKLRIARANYKALLGYTIAQLKRTNDGGRWNAHLAKLELLFATYETLLGGLGGGEDETLTLAQATDNLGDFVDEVSASINYLFRKPDQRLAKASARKKFFPNDLDGYKGVGEAKRDVEVQKLVALLTADATHPEYATLAAEGAAAVVAYQEAFKLRDTQEGTEGDTINQLNAGFQTIGRALFGVWGALITAFAEEADAAEQVYNYFDFSNAYVASDDEEPAVPAAPATPPTL